MYNAITLTNAEVMVLDGIGKMDENQKRYWASDKGKATQKKYQQSEKGKEARRRYLQSEKGKLATLRYYLSRKGKTARQDKAQLHNILSQCSQFLKDNPNKSVQDFLIQVGQHK